jgi:hypothetical protein
MIRSVKLFAAATVVACGLSVVLAIGADGAEPASTPSKAASLLAAWNTASGSGDLDSPEGRRLLLAAQQDEAARQAGKTVLHDQATPTEPCGKTFENNGISKADVQSGPNSIVWGLWLYPNPNWPAVVHMDMQAWADNREWNGWQAKNEWWDYNFHSSMGRTFQVKGSSASYTMHPGSQVSFYWFWYNTADRRQGGYSWVNCLYTP